MSRTGPEVDITVPAAPTAAREARRALAACRLVAPGDEATLLLLVSELVSNSVRHAGLAPSDAIRLRARANDGATHVEVCDGGRTGGLPSRRRSDPAALEPGGLGLKLVDEMADRWGVERRDDQMCVWFELKPESGRLT
jgi:anti-sigma regulatory factor (Ser/Thr protein kinase)